MYCQNCGTQGNDGEYCRKCGTRIGGNTESATVSNITNQECCLIIQRKKSMSGMASSFEIFIDNKKIANIKNGQSINLQILSGIHTIQAKQFTNKSDVVQFEITPDNSVIFEVGYTHFSKIFISNTYANENKQPLNNSTNDVAVKKYYINNNSIGSIVGSLKVFDENNQCIAKVKSAFMQNSKVLVDNNDHFLLRIDEVDMINHRFEVSFDENGSNLQFEVAKKNNFKVGFGLGHFVLLPLASIPFGSYYGVSKRGDIYIRKNGKLHEICINNSIIARIDVKKGMFAQVMSSKSCLEVLTSDNALTMYAIALFIIREINDYFK